MNVSALCGHGTYANPKFIGRRRCSAFEHVSSPRCQQQRQADNGRIICTLCRIDQPLEARCNKSGPKRVNDSGLNETYPGEVRPAAFMREKTQSSEPARGEQAKKYLSLISPETYTSQGSILSEWEQRCRWRVYSPTR